MTRFSPPYLGAAYYPEAWPSELVDDDIRLMIDAGLNAVRVAEFAWSSMEPREGQIELGWLRRVVDKLGEAGIATIMCTPSCTPPAWLTAKYPEVSLVEHTGRRVQHGSRRHVCPNSPVYREHCKRIAEALAEVFGNDERVIGWQIDNEVYLWGDWGCYCDICIAAFRDSLRQQFGTIEALNEAWGTSLWSQSYTSFEEIPAPRPDICHHPSLLTAWIQFQNASMVDYVKFQAEVLHACVTQPVGTDMMPMLGVGYEAVHQCLDVVQYNHYDSMENLWRQVFWMDYVRPVKPIPFWNTETATCWNGGTTANGYKDPGFCRANSWLPIALGGEANLYWLWRAHWSGQELMHGSVVSSCGRPLHIMDEVRDVARGFKTAANFLNGTRPTPTGLAVHLSTLAWAQLRFQPIANEFDYVEYMIQRIYRPLMSAGLRSDVLDPAASLDAYRVVFSPFLPALDESGLRSRLLSWIEAGGTWVVGPMSDVRTMHGTKPTHAPFVSLEEWAGLYCKYELPGDPRDFALAWSDGRASRGSVWYSGFTRAPESSATPLATYARGPLAGLSAVTETPVGQGRIIVLGTLLLPEDLSQLLREIAQRDGVPVAAETRPNVLYVPREGHAGRGAVVIELENRPGSLRMPEPMVNLLDGTERNGVVEVLPYQVMVLRVP